MDVTEVCGQERQTGRDIGVGAVGVNQGPDGKAVTEVVQPWPAGARARLQTSLVNQALEGPLDVAVDQAGAGQRDEQAWSLGLGIQLAASPEVVAESVDGRAVEWELARLPEFAQPHREHTLSEVEIVPIEADGLADAHAGHCEQGDQ